MKGRILRGINITITSDKKLIYDVTRANLVFLA